MISPQEDINEYIEKCKLKCEYHRNQAIISKHYDNLLSIMSVVLSSAQVLAMVTELVIEQTNSVITITGAAFAFFVAINNQLKNSYAFLSLSVSHHHLADEYSELRHDLATMRVPEIDIPKLTSKFLCLEQKSHLQQLKSCDKKLCCFKSNLF